MSFKLQLLITLFGIFKNLDTQNAHGFSWNLRPFVTFVKMIIKIVVKIQHHYQQFSVISVYGSGLLVKETITKRKPWTFRNGLTNIFTLPQTGVESTHIHTASP
jgi:hypothetical protein